jgi:hypothetical protein
MKQLYFLHIPKTGGNFLNNAICPELDKINLSHYTTSSTFPHTVDFSKQIYIAGHWGTYPIKLLPNIDTACLIRNPIDARISYFNFIYPFMIAPKQDSEYNKYSKYIDKFKYYVFEDKKFELHNNFQSRFICNSANDIIFDQEKFLKSGEALISQTKIQEGYAFGWFIENNNTSYDNCLKEINNFKFIDCFDNIAGFSDKIKKWFLENYNINIYFNIAKKENVSSVEYNNVVYTSEKIKDMLTDNDLSMIKYNNSLDQKVYEYVKSL